MRALMGLPVFALIFGFMAGAGVHVSSDLIPVVTVVCLAYAMLGLVDVVPEAMYRRAHERRRRAERRWAAARAAVTHRL